MADKLIEAFLANYPAQVQEVALALRGLILSVIPAAVEMVDPPGNFLFFTVSNNVHRTLRFAVFGTPCFCSDSRTGSKEGVS